MTLQLARRIFVFGLCFGMWSAAASAQEKPAQEGASPAKTAQQTLTLADVVNVIGVAGIPRNATCALKAEGGTLGFACDKAKAEIPISSISDVFTGEDSQRVVSGTMGTLTMFAPYGGGRFLSLFRTNVDSLVIEYRDAKGGLHGVVLRMTKGASATVKKELVTRGAHASIPVEEEMQKRQEKKKKSTSAKPAKSETKP